MQMWSFLIRFELWNIQTFVARLHATIFYAIATLKMQLKPSKQFGKCIATTWQVPHNIL